LITGKYVMKNFQRCSTAFLFMFVAITAYASVSQSSIAQTTEAPSVLWGVTCNNNANPNQLTCTMSQTIFQNGTGQRIISASVFKNSGTYGMLLSLPHGIDLTSGVDVSIDEGKAQKFAIQTSDANGAYSRFELTPKLISAMRNGNVLIVNILGAGGNPVRMEMSLSGFSNSFSLMSR